MVQYEYHFESSRTADYAVFAVAACISAYCALRPVIRYNPVKSRKAIKANVTSKRRNPSQESLTVRSAYAPDAFPGPRLVDTPYGRIQVFEWGPEQGEKVLLMHGIGTPCVALANMAHEFVRRGCRVMVFDFFGRGYSDTPSDLPFDDRLYTSQILLVLASSHLPWTGADAFHLLGYSLGGAIAAVFAAYHPHMLRSVTLVCPGGLVRSSHVGWKSRLLYAEGALPERLVNMLVRRRLEPRRGVSADIPDVDEHEASENVDFDEVPVRKGSTTRVGDVVAWQLRSNPGFPLAYLSTIRNAPIYGQHNAVWRTLAQKLAARRPIDDTDAPPGLPEGRICLVLAEDDPIVVKEEWIADSMAVLGEDAVDIRVIPGGHEIAISRGEEVAKVAMAAWQRG